MSEGQNNSVIINTAVAEEASLSLKEQYDIYRMQVSVLRQQYEYLKRQSVYIGQILKKMQDRNIIDNHISSMMKLTNNFVTTKRENENERDIEIISNYFKQVEEISKDALQTIFNIRKLLTGQNFDIYLEDNEKIYSFSVDDIQSHIGSIIPVYGDSLDKMIKNMLKNSRSIAIELDKLGFTLERRDSDTEVENLKEYQLFVAHHLKENKKKMSMSRQLESAVYLFTRNDSADFSNIAVRHSLHIILGWYIKHGGTKDTVAMYKLGDAIKEVNHSFTNIEIKRHNGHISLTMIANAIRDLNIAMQKEGQHAKEHLIKIFTANPNKLSSPVEKAAQKAVIKAIEDVFKKFDKE